MATSLKEQVMVTDARVEERWPTWSSRVLANGLKACWSAPIPDRNGRALGAFSVYSKRPGDLTPLLRPIIDRFMPIVSIVVERVRGDAALKRSEAFLTEAQRLSSTGGMLWNVSTDEIVWSEEIYRIFELDPSLTPTLELILTRLHPDDAADFQQMYARQRGELRDFEHDHRLLMPDQSIKYLHVVAHASHGHDGHPQYTAAVQNVTERRLAEMSITRLRAELARVARVKSFGVLTASIAHEVNQPLAGIVTNASTCMRMLAADPPDIAGAIETARRTIRDGNRASDVISRLRALFSKQDTTAEAVDLNEGVRAVVALAAGELQRGHVDVKMNLAQDLPAAHGDRVQLQQVILNLLLNAAEALTTVRDRPRQVLISTLHGAGDQLILSVRDSGAGLDPQIAERLFEGFHTTKSGGMGIGLTVSRSIVESHRGRLWVEPNQEAGVTFSFSVPRSPPELAGEAAPAVRPFAAAGSEGAALSPVVSLR
jgi:signal transduction histidine kinase